MTPRDVDQLTPDEYRAFRAFAIREIKRHNQAVKKAKK